MSLLSAERHDAGPGILDETADQSLDTGHHSALPAGRVSECRTPAFPRQGRENDTSLFLEPWFLSAFGEYLDEALDLAPRNAHVQSGLHACGIVKATSTGKAIRRIPLLPWHAFWQETTCDQSLRYEALAGFAAQIGRDFEAASFDLHPTISDVRPLLWAGWSAEVRYTYQSDLANWHPGHVAPSVRRRAKRAAAAGVRIVDNLTADAFAAFWDDMQRQNALPLPGESSKLREFLAMLTGRGVCQLWGALLPDGPLVACTCVLLDGPVAYYWLAAFDRQEPHHGASNQLLHLQMLQRLRGCAEQFDWVGANTPAIARYKQSFAPRLVSYYRVHWSNQSQEAESRTSPWRTWLIQCPLFRKG